MKQARATLFPPRQPVRFDVRVAPEPFPKGRRIILGDIEGPECREYGWVETSTDIEPATAALQSARNRQWSKAVPVVYDARPAIERLAGHQIRPNSLD